MPILTIPEYFQFVAVVSLLAAVVIPLSGMLESEFMEADDDEIGPQEPCQRIGGSLDVECGISYSNCDNQGETVMTK